MLREQQKALWKPTYSSLQNVNGQDDKRTSKERVSQVSIGQISGALSETIMRGAMDMDISSWNNSLHA